MSWTPEVYIGELRPWPESVRVVRGNSGETRRYEGVGRSEDGVDATIAPDDYTTALTNEFIRVLDERDTLNSKFEVAQSMRHAEYEQYTKENAKLRAQLAEWKRVAESKQDIIDHMRDANAENASLRDRITTQAQTIQAYRDESREWREVAERAQAENDKLRELVLVMAYCMQYERECDGCRLNDADGTITAPVGCDGLLDRLRELGIEEG